MYKKKKRIHSNSLPVLLNHPPRPKFMPFKQVQNEMSQNIVFAGDTVHRGGVS